MHQLALDRRRVCAGQGDSVRRQPFHTEQAVVAQWRLAVCRAQAVRTVLRAAVVSQCLSLVLTQLRPLSVKLRQRSAVSKFMSVWYIFMSKILDFMSDIYNLMSDEHIFMSDEHIFMLHQHNFMSDFCDVKSIHSTFMSVVNCS